LSKIGIRIGKVPKKQNFSFLQKEGFCLEANRHESSVRSPFLKGKTFSEFLSSFFYCVNNVNYVKQGSTRLNHQKKACNTFFSPKTSFFLQKIHFILFIVKKIAQKHFLYPFLPPQTGFFHSIFFSPYPNGIFSIFTPQKRLVRLIQATFLESAKG